MYTCWFVTLSMDVVLLLFVVFDLLVFATVLW
mgnify:CR=1 FL=1